PEFRITERWYFESLRQDYDPETNTLRRDTVPGFRRAPDWSAGAALTSKVHFTWTYPKSRKLQAVRHVLTPSAGLSYRPDQSTEISGPFGPNGTPGSYSPFDMGIYG